VPVRPITFLSDYGLEDEFVGVCHAVIASIVPEAQVIDISHGIRRHDVRRGAAVLADAVVFAPPGVHIAVVDPGVGTPRRAIAVASAAGGRFFVGPDNGLLVPALGNFGGAAEAVDVSESPVRLEPVSATFHGRDIFAPVAAHLALGEPLSALGEPIGAASLEVLGEISPQIEEGMRLTAEVGDVDSFGNAALLASAEDATAVGLELGKRLRVTAPRRSDELLYARTFADVAEGELLLYLDSSGALALAVNRGDAARRLDLAPGDRIALTSL
jgi:S-adenosyl-L-methionine hydrolase (adenosine-forming)